MIPKKSIAEKAGFHLFKKFTLEKAASLKRELSFEQWRTVKRLLKDVTGRDVIGSEQKLRNYIEDKCYYQFEAGSFVSSNSRTVTFVRIVDLQEVIKHSLKNLGDAGDLTNIENIPLGTLSILLCTDIQTRIIPNKAFAHFAQQHQTAFKSKSKTLGHL